MEHEQLRDKKYLKSFLIFYGVIVACWLFFMIFHFTTYFRDDSFVVSEYLMSGKQQLRTEVGTSLSLTLVDILVKANMFIVAALVSTVFLLYNILPRMKNLNAWWMILGSVAAYLPALLTLLSILSGVRLSTSIWVFDNYLTMNKFLTLFILYPLNFAVFFYLYYLLETFVIEPKKQSR